MDRAPITAPALAPGRPPRSLRILLLLAALLAALASVLASRGTDRNEIAVLAAPPLPSFAADCEASSNAPRAERLERSALAKIARYPFAPADGVAALRLLDEARSCYPAGHDPMGRDRVAARAEAWRKRVERDYRDHLTRYERARSAGKLALALPDIAFLLALLNDDGAFTSRLRSDQRALALSPLAGDKP